MGDRSAIEWTDATWNPIRARSRATGRVGWFCTHASEGCRNCYAETFNARLGTRVGYKAQLAGEVELFIDEEVLMQPLRWKRPREIFVGSMTDLFGEFVPDEWLWRIFTVMQEAHQHTFQVLTKRAARMNAFIHWNPPARNVWGGVSIEDQATANQRVRLLVQTPFARRFVSAEPLLGAIDLETAQCTCPWPADAKATRHLLGCPADRRPHGLWSIDQVIVGGESGPNARPMHNTWAERLRDQCAVAEAAFFFKQWGEWAPVCAIPDTEVYFRPPPVRDPEATRRCKVDTLVMHADGRLFRGRERHDIAAYAAGSGAMLMMRIGKGRAGRLLGGREWNGVPECSPCR
jgi:protein gp37